MSPKTFLITGAGSGIGAATAISAAERGANLVLTGRRRARLDEVAVTCRAAGSRCLVVPGDVTVEADCIRVVEATLREFGAIDVLFNNAGVIHRGLPLHETEPAVWDETFAVNVRGTYLMSRAALPAMLERGAGSIINNASFVGLTAGDEVPAYSAAKGAVVLMTRSMARDYAASGIRVNCVCPGSVDTPMLEREFEEMGGAETMRPAFAQKHPIGRIASPEEVAAAVLFLASDEASFITGISLPIDGGRLA